MKKYGFLLMTYLTIVSANGQTPTPTPTCAACDYSHECINGPANPDKIAEQFAPMADGDNQMPLYWDVYLPAGDPPPTLWPVVILVKDAGFEKGRRCDGELKCIARDLAESGFAVVSIDIRHDQLATDKIPCQNKPAFSPQFAVSQISDLRKAIRRARTPQPSSILYGKLTIW